ncbi:MAG: dihydrodipicolinate synthase family protein [Verrucomicrobiales bacterium]|nr:dihydrodipicolinate synthase family protein [Verrucomicrobiales bacterium]
MENTELLPLRSHLSAGQVIPALPLALREDRSWSERHQRALVRYYLDAGAGGLAVGVHSTQFEIRDPDHQLFEPVLKLASEEIDRYRNSEKPFAKIAGVCGETNQAVAEARYALEHRYDATLLSLSALREESDEDLLQHCERIAEILPVIGFYLQPAIGGRSYSFDFWRRFVEIENVVAIKVAPFDRYATLDVARALGESGRSDISLYTGNDDNIIHDLLTRFPYGPESVSFSGGLLGQWAIGTQKAVHLLENIKSGAGTAADWSKKNAELTDLNSAIFDPGHDFAGCLSGMNEMLRRDGLVPSHACLEPSEVLSAGQKEELDRVSAAYPQWLDTEFIAANRERWFSEI